MTKHASLTLIAAALQLGVTVTAAPAATLCARSGVGSATVYTPMIGTTVCRSGETAFQTEPPARSASIKGYEAYVGAALTALTPSLEVAVAEAGTYLVVVSGLAHYNPGAVNEDAVIQCRIQKRSASGVISDALSTTTTVQTLKRYGWDHLATTATGYFATGDRPVLTCQQYSASTWKSVPLNVAQAKITAVKLSQVIETAIQQPPTPPVN